MSKNTFVILGDEAFQKEKTAQVIDELVSKLGGSKENIEVIPPEKQNWQKIAENVRTFSLFGTPKFFLVKDAAVFLAEEKIQTVISDSREYFENNDFENAAKNLVRAVNLLDFSGEEYKELREAPSLLKTYLKDCAENLDFVDELLKRYALPEKLPEKSAEIDFEELMKKMPEGHFLIITAENWDKRTKTYKTIQKAAALFEKPVVPLTPRDLRKNKEARINEFLKNNKKPISQDVVMLLKERAFEADSLSSSLEKLVLISLDKANITSEDINNAFDDGVSPNMQNLPEMIRKNDSNGIFTTIKNPKNTKPDFIKLTGYFKSLLRNAISIKEISDMEDYADYPAFERKFYHKYLDIFPKETLKSQHPYYMFQCHLAFKNFSAEKLKKAYLRLFEIDKALKTTQKNPLDLYIDFFGFLLSPKN